MNMEPGDAAWSAAERRHLEPPEPTMTDDQADEIESMAKKNITYLVGRDERNDYRDEPDSLKSDVFDLTLAECDDCGLGHWEAYEVSAICADAVDAYLLDKALKPYG